MATFTESQISALAPDPASAKAGRDLANPRKWSNLGASERAAWGECQGSGKLPYQAQIDLANIAFKCTCPSRKFPCKHGLGLGLILATQPALFSTTVEPDWVAKWLTDRSVRAERKVQREETAPDPEAQAKRVAAREAKVKAGVDQLELWLCDLLRLGISSAPSRDYAFWDGMAARLVDAQATGLARMVRGLGSIPNSGPQWEERFLHEMASLTLAIAGLRNSATLPEDVRADIRAAIGFTVGQDEVLAGSGVLDEWMVVGRSVDNEDRLRIQRSWIRGRESKRIALVLDFSVAGAPFDTSLPTGAAFRGEVVYFPSVAPQRALIKSRESGTPFTPVGSLLPAAHTEYRKSLTVSPWITAWPMQIDAAVPRFQGSQFSLQDESGHALPLRATPESAWKLMAVSGGHPVSVFGEWDGARLRPLTLWSGPSPVLMEDSD